MSQDKQRLCVREDARAWGDRCRPYRDHVHRLCDYANVLLWSRAYILMHERIHLCTNKISLYKDGFTTKSILVVWDKDNEHCVCG